MTNGELLRGADKVTMEKSKEYRDKLLQEIKEDHEKYVKIAQAFKEDDKTNLSNFDVSDSGNINMSSATYDVDPKEVMLNKQVDDYITFRDNIILEAKEQLVNGSSLDEVLASVVFQGVVYGKTSTR